MTIKLRAVYTNTNGHRLQPYHLSVRDGAGNQRVICRNFTTGQDELWTPRLFLAEHRLERRVSVTS